MEDETGIVTWCEECQTIGDCCGKEKPIGWIEVSNEPTE